MLLKELFQMDMMSVKQVKTVKDLLMFFKMKGIKSIPTETFIKELERRGIIIDVASLIKNIEGMSLISDANKDEIKFNGSIDQSEPELKSDEKLDMNKERVSQMARSSMLRRRNK
jgi:hypothetical protein